MSTRTIDHPFAVFGFVTTAMIVVVGCTSGATPAASAGPSSAASAAASASASTAAASSAASAGPQMVSVGSFHDVDGTASGTAALEHLADGTFAVVFEDFSIASADGLTVVLAENKDVTKTADVDRTKVVDLGPLKGTSGMQDYPVPSSADAMTLHSVVIWDGAMAHAIAVAPLAAS